METVSVGCTHLQSYPAAHANAFACRHSQKQRWFAASCSSKVNIDMPLGIYVHVRDRAYTLALLLGRLDMNFMNDTINVPAPFICCQERCPDLRVQFRDGQVHLGLGMCVQRNAKSLSASHRNNMATIVHAKVVRARGLCTTSAFASKTASRSAIGAKWFECCGIQLDSGTTSGDICACNAFISSCSTSTLIMSSDEGLHTYMHARR